MKKKLTHQNIARVRRYIQRRNALRAFVQTTLYNIKTFDQVFVIVMAILIGVAAGYISAGFRSLIEVIHNILWGPGALIDIVRTLPYYQRILVPVLGITAVAVFVNRYAKEAKGHGVPEVMEAVATKNGFIRMRVVLVKALASAMSIASGAAVGREGPIVQIGSAFGSTVGQIFQVSQRRMKTFIGCGAAAGIAATFNAPIAGAIFASEIILGDFSVAAIGPIIIASVFGTVVSRGIYGDFPAFIPPVYSLNSSIEIIFYIILGIATGFAAWLFVRSLYFTEDVFDRLKIPVWTKAVAGGSLLAIIAIFIPEVMGVGYESVDRILANDMSFILAGMLLFGKIFATSISMGAGASGGIFAPSLFMGAMLGGAMGKIFHHFLPEITASPGAYALVGMAAMVAGTTHAPVTAILIIFELTSEYTVILPLMVTSIIATVISSRLLDGNIYTLKLKRRGIDIYSGTDINVLNKITIPEIKEPFVDVVSEDTTVTELLDHMALTDHPVIYVCDMEKKLSGIVTNNMVRRFLNHAEEIHEHAVVSDIYNTHFPKIEENVPVYEVLRKMLDEDMLAIPVVDENGFLTGQILRRDILREYQDMLIQTQRVGHMASQMKFAHHFHQEKQEVIPGYYMARINAPSEFVGRTINDLNVRNRYQVDIFLIRKFKKGKVNEFMPLPKTVVEADDQLILFGKIEKIEYFCKPL